MTNSSSFKEYRSSIDYHDHTSSDERALIDDGCDHRPSSSRFKCLYQRYGHFAALQLLFLLFHAGILVLMQGKFFNVHPRQSLIYCKCLTSADFPRFTDLAVAAPAEKAVEYERVRFNATLVIDSPYNGPPSPEVDGAWSDLLWSQSIW